MITMTLNKAKARLHQLVEAAESGEQVVLMRGSEVVATLVPLHAGDLQINSPLTEEQARRFWAELEDENSRNFPSPAKAVSFLRKQHS